MGPSSSRSCKFGQINSSLGDGGIVRGPPRVTENIRVNVGRTPNTVHSAVHVKFCDDAAIETLWSWVY